jgi:von Willebrand factor type A domain/Aerotolerance regulator N-terminal
MRFANPGMLWWGLLVAVPLALYLFRRKPRTVRVSTLIFFKALAREHQESTWLRRLKHLLSLLLSIAVIAGATLAMARPVVAPAAGALRNVVILLDRSASMAARDDGGERLARAVAQLRNRLAGLPASVPVSVMAYDRRPEILLAPSLDRRAVERALSEVRVRPVEGDARAGLKLAARLAALERPARIWHATDEPPAQPVPEESVVAGDGSAAVKLAGVDVEHIAVASGPFRNAGITAFQLRALPLEHGRFEAFVQVHATGTAVSEVKLDMRLDGKLVALRQLSVAAGGRERLLIPVEAGEGKVLSLKVSVPGDALDLDNEVHARIPEPRPVRVVWVSQSVDPFTKLALTSITRRNQVRVFQAVPSSWPPKQKPDVAIFDGWLPKTWPTDCSVVLIDPPGSAGPVEAVRIKGRGLPLSAVRPTDSRHPLLFGVASARVAVTQTCTVDTDGPLEPLWVGPSGPLLLAGEVKGQRLVVMAFSPRRSERLGLMASYPLLIGNAVFWSARPRVRKSNTGTHRTGELLELAGREIAWTPSASGASRVERLAIEGRWTELDRQGLWQTDAGRKGSAALLSVRETLPPDATGEEGGSASSAAEISSVGLLRGDLTWLVLWAVFAVLLLESWLYHRKAVN